MVHFSLKEEHSNELLYEYWPECDRSKRPGMILFYKDRQEARLLEVAELDFIREISVEEQNFLINAISKAKIETGETDRLELATTPMLHAFYADPVISKIKSQCKNGPVPKEGSCFCY